MLSRWIGFLVAAALFFNSVASHCTADLSFQFLTTHPDAVNQATVRGKTLWNISVFDGQLFFGYGDWAADTGPMKIRSFNTSTASWSNALLTFGTEAITHYRQIAGKLYTVNVDPLGLPGVNSGGFARGESLGGGNTSWASFSNIPATHTFDIASSNGNDIWVVGSQGTLASVWRSTDGGQSFNVARQDGPAPGSAPFVFSRYTGVAIYNDLVYVQRTDVNGADVNHSLTFDGTSWAQGPDLLSATNGFVFRPSQFNGELVYLDSDLGLGNLYRFDGTQSSLAYNQMVRDYFLTEGRIYALTSGSEIISSTNLNSWDFLGLAPANARSLAIYDNSIYVGTTDASLYLAVNPLITSVPEPSSFFLAFIAMGAVLVSRNVARRSNPKIPDGEIV